MPIERPPYLGMFLDTGLTRAALGEFYCYISCALGLYIVLLSCFN